MTFDDVSDDDGVTESRVEWTKNKTISKKTISENVFGKKKFVVVVVHKFVVGDVCYIIYIHVFLLLLLFLSSSEDSIFVVVVVDEVYFL